MLIKTTYTGETVRRCDGCGRPHLGTGAEVYWVERDGLVVATCCVVDFAVLYTRLRADLATRWSRGALVLGADSMLDALDDAT